MKGEQRRDLTHLIERVIFQLCDQLSSARMRDAMPGLPVPPWPLVGEGLWSSVHDLGDGTVLKLVRRQTSGLGSGVAIHRREVLALAALDGLATARDLSA